MKKGKICIYPGCTELAIHSSYCRVHGNEKSRERHLKRYRECNGLVVKTKCAVCGIVFMAPSYRKYCDQCSKSMMFNINNSKYVARKQNGARIDEHRQIAKKVGVITQKNDVVHHMDGNKSNNDPSNLVVLSLADHSRLHAYLRGEQLRQPNKTVAQLSWEFIWQNYIPYCFCNDVPGHHYPLSDLED